MMSFKQTHTHTHTNIYTHLYAQYWISAFVCRTCGRARTARVKLSLLLIVISKHTAFSLVLFNVTLHDHRLRFPWWSDCLLMTFTWFTTVLFRFACITQLAWSKMRIIFSNSKGLSSEFHLKNAISIESFSSRLSQVSRKSKSDFFELAQWNVLNCSVKRKIGRYSLIISRESTSKENHKKLLSFLDHANLHTFFSQVVCWRCCCWICNFHFQHDCNVQCTLFTFCKSNC